MYIKQNPDFLHQHTHSTVWHMLRDWGCVLFCLSSHPTGAWSPRLLFPTDRPYRQRGGGAWSGGISGSDQAQAKEWRPRQQGAECEHEWNSDQGQRGARQRSLQPTALQRLAMYYTVAPGLYILNAFTCVPWGLVVLDKKKKSDLLWIGQLCAFTLR